ncbi:MAU2 chromatid cohesion factor -like protein [Brachionus plicatilis]|uniref:Cohesin loading complex subunit SCC4 homolog n=1 Tax=Brachionus plicatilis TaxID=10195 RepID=A0A3M7Q9A1_BRAPC|nr:MAU2 chromatid cohesion factor -like protein [Brachionus plicatilis]
MSNQYNTNQMNRYNQNLAMQPNQTNFIQNSYNIHSPKSEPKHTFYGSNSAHPVQITNQVKSNQLIENQSNTLNIYLALLGLADSFQKSNQHRLCIHCLESMLLIKPIDIPVQLHFQLQIKARLNLSRLYLKYTSKSNQIINMHLEKATIMIQNLNVNDEYRYVATYIVYKILQKQKAYQDQLRQNPQTDQSQLINIFSLDLIKNMIESSKALPVWHLRLIFLIGDLCFKEKDYQSAAYYINIGIQYCAQNKISSYTHIMLILTKGLIHLAQKNPNELQTTMEPCGKLIENFHTKNIYQIETLKVFFLVLQVAYFTQCGQAKSVKNTLKSLQTYIKNLASRLCDDNQEKEFMISKDPCENFLWLHKDHFGILTFLLAILNYMQTGCFEKADKLVEKCLSNVQILKSRETSLNNTSNFSSVYANSVNVTKILHFLVLESQIRCKLTTGSKIIALKCIHEEFTLCDNDHKMLKYFSSQLHCLLGLYSLSVNNKESAANHFNISLKSTNDKDLWIYSALNLALCYIENPNKKQFMSILDNVVNDKFHSNNTALNAFSSFFKALRSFINNQLPQAQELLREAIVLANSEDLLNISANAYLFYGHISLLTNQVQESYNMIINGLDLADKMCDVNLKLYGNSLLKSLYRNFNDQRETESNSKYIECENQNSIEIFQATKQPEHMLIKWSNNLPPSQLLTNIKKFNPTENALSTKNNLSETNSPKTPINKSGQNSPMTPQGYQSPRFQYPQSPNINSPQYRAMQPHQFNASPQNQYSQQQFGAQYQSPVHMNQHSYHSPQHTSPSLHHQIQNTQQYMNQPVQQQYLYQQQQQNFQRQNPHQNNRF